MPPSLTMDHYELGKKKRDGNGATGGGCLSAQSGQGYLVGVEHPKATSKMGDSWKHSSHIRVQTANRQSGRGEGSEV